MSTVIDSLIVTLGLDPKGFSAGSKRAKEDMRNMSEEAKKRAAEIKRSGESAAQFFSKLRNEALALAAAFTVGTGLKGFVESTIKGAANLGYMANNLSMSTQNLDAWQRAAQRAGGTAEGITAQLKESATELANVKMGRGSEAATEFYRQGGIDVRNFKDGNEFLLARSKILRDIYAVDPTRAMVVAQRMGISEDSFNLLKQGPEAVQSLIDEQMKLSKVTEEQTKKAQELNKKWLDFRQTLETTAMQILLNNEPAISKFLARLQEMSDWVASHQDDILRWINTSVDALKKFVDMSDEIAQSVGGWKNVLVGLIGLKVASFALSLVAMATSITAAFAPATLALAGFAAAYVSVRKLNEATGGKIDSMVGRVFEFFGDKGASHEAAKLKPRSQEDIDRANKAAQSDKFGSLMDKSKYAVNKLMGFGWSKEQASGMVGSLMQESRLDENAVNPSSGAYGIAQWLSKDRIAAFQKWAGKSLKNSRFDEQLSFMNYELTQGKEKSAGNAIKSARTEEEAAVMHSKLYERPGESEANDSMRKAFARQVNNAINKPTQAIDVANFARGINPVGTNQRIASNNSNEVVINGDINVNTQATDAAGIANGIRTELQQRLAPSQSNTGLY